MLRDQYYKPAVRLAYFFDIYLKSTHNLCLVIAQQKMRKYPKNSHFSLSNMHIAQITIEQTNFLNIFKKTVDGHSSDKHNAPRSRHNGSLRALVDELKKLKNGYVAQLVRAHHS